MQDVKKFRLMAVAAGTVAAVSGAQVALADEGEPHEDAYVTFDSGKIRIGGILLEDPQNPVITPGLRAFEGEFGEEFQNFADEPGMYADSLPVGATIGFNILGAVREWNGSDFSTLSAETISLSSGFGVPGAPVATSPAGAGDRVIGFDFATADSTGGFDEHPELRLDAPASNGVYLLTLVLRTDYVDPGLGESVRNSLPFHFVLGQNVDEVVLDAALDYASLNAASLPAPGVAAFGVAGLAALARRRR